MRRAQVEVKVERVIFLDHRSSFVSFNKGGFRKTNQSKCLYTINIIIFDV